MKCVERVNLSVAKWLLTQSKTSLSPILKRKSEDPTTIDEKYNKLTNYLKSVVKCNGVCSMLYSYSATSNNELCGRLYSPFSIQSIQREFRGVLMSHTTDIDMCNAHPVILRYVCNKHNISCPQLEYYINHRDEILAKFSDRDKAKTLFLTSINDSKYSKTERNPDYKRFDKEMKDIQAVLYDMPEYKNILDNITVGNNKPGKLISRIMCKYENEILQHAIEFINSKNIPIMALMFDGLMIDGIHYDNTEMITELTEYCNSKFENLNMRWNYKPHSTEITLPEDIGVEYEPQTAPSLKDIKKQEQADLCREITERLASRVEEFEKCHFKIINKGLYVHEYMNELGHKIVHFQTFKQLVDANRHLETAFTRYGLENGGLMPCSFIDYWTTNNPTIRQYDDVDVYPAVGECPDNIYNMWMPFYADSLLQTTDIEINHEYIEFFKTHLKILSGHDMKVFEYFEKWIAHMFQFPQQKSTCPILISQEGSGKGTLNQVIKLIMGGKKYTETTNPARDIFGSFNAQMADSYLVNINEISKKDLCDYMGLLKGLITDSALIINEKGISQYTIKSFHRFIMTTNNTDPIVLSADNRRFWVVRSSDEKKGDKIYFDRFNDIMNDPSFIKSVYFYFMNMEGVDEFIKMPLPVTEFHRNIQDSNVSDVERWLRDYVLMNSDKTTTNELIKDLYSAYSCWSESEGNKFKTTSKKFSLELANCQIHGVYKGVHTKRGDTKLLNISELKMHFNIGCLVEVDNSSDVDTGVGTKWM